MAFTYYIKNTSVFESIAYVLRDEDLCFAGQNAVLSSIMTSLYNEYGDDLYNISLGANEDLSVTDTVDSMLWQCMHISRGIPSYLRHVRALMFPLINEIDDAIVQRKIRIKKATKLNKI